MDHFSTKVHSKYYKQYDRTRQNRIGSERHIDADWLFGGIASSLASRCDRCGVKFNLQTNSGIIFRKVNAHGESMFTVQQGRFS